MTSIEKILGRQIEMNEVRKSIVTSFGDVFKQDTKNVCLKEII
jgi:lipoate-protein ligase A